MIDYGFRKNTSRNSSTDQAKQPVSIPVILPSAEYEDLRRTAINMLISEQRCTSLKDDKHKIVVYGNSMNVLNPYRRWMYDQLYAQALETFNKTQNPAAYPDVEKIHIAVNKAVLYVDEKEVNALIKKLSNERARLSEQLA